MRKILAGYVIFFVFLFTLFFGNQLYLLKGTSGYTGYKYKSETGITYVAKTEGKHFYIYDQQGDWAEGFITGVNIGAGSPGYFPGEFGITKEDYLRWFQYLSDLNINTIRVYVAQMPNFYEAFLEYNREAKNPLYLMHGVYLNEADIAQYQDAYAENGKIRNDFYQDIRNIVDIIHGNAWVEKLPGHAGGTYTADISGYVTGWILGIEWDQDFVLETNAHNSDKTGFDGQYVYTQNASPFEVFLAGAADLAIAYETENYQEQRPLALCNWVTTDPLDHPNEPNPAQEDAVSVDVEHLKAKRSFEPGFFASYHVYPYYPDFFSYEDKYLQDGKNNTYRGYLNELNNYHTMPVLVSEVGIPSSRGIAHENILSGFNQGHIEESRQAEILINLMNDIQAENCMGAMIFSWHDEWFKTTWNTMDYDIPERRPFWIDYQTNEQNFGLLAFDPGEVRSVAYVDGNIEEWTPEDVVVQNGSYQLSVKSDEKFLYLLAKVPDFAQETVYIPIDTLPDQGKSQHQDTLFEIPADFLLVLQGAESSTLFVDSYYDVTYYQYGFLRDFLPRDLSREQKESGGFTPITLVLSNRLEIPGKDITVPFSTIDTGKLKFGITHPDSPAYDSLSDFYHQDGYVEIRLPWLLLNVMDPSSGQIMANLYEHDWFTPQQVGPVFLQIVPSGNVFSAAPTGSYTWPSWEFPTYHERLKKSYPILQNYFASFHAPRIARSNFDLFWVEWNKTSVSQVADWFPIQPALNYLIAFLLSIILYFFVVLIFIHITSAFREHKKNQLKNQLRTLLQTKPESPNTDQYYRLLAHFLHKLLSFQGMVLLTELFQEITLAQQAKLRLALLTIGYEEYLKKQLRTRKLSRLTLVVQLIGKLDLKKLAPQVTQLLYTHQENIDFQYQGCLTLALMGDQESILQLSNDQSFVHTLSFRSLQEVFKAYTGDKIALFKGLLKSPDLFVLRICLKRIGSEKVSELAEEIVPFLDHPNFNVVVDATRSLGQLQYPSAAPQLIPLLQHEKWEVRSIAVSALALINTQAYTQAYEAELIHALHDREWQVRYNAAKALKDSANAQEILALILASGDQYAFEIFDFMTQYAQIEGGKMA